MDMDKLTALVCAVQQGDRQAADELYTAVHQGLYYYISKTVDDPELAQDLLQETFIEIYQTIDKLKEPAAFLKWSRQIAYHKCTAYCRKTQDVLVDENEDGQSIFDTLEEDRTEFIPDEALDKEDLKQTIRAMIAELPMEQRSAIMLRYFDEISVKEIAEIQGVTEGTVKSRLNYGRKAIQKSVEDYEKRSGVKLHCAGVVPLLLWLFASEASAVSATAATAAAPVVAQGAKEGVKAAGKFALKKWIAGITAAAVVTGGAAAAVLLQPEPEEPPMQWYGYGTISSSNQDRRFELVVESMDDATISGHLEVSYLYDIKHESDFTGTGTVEDGTVTYTIIYEDPLVAGLPSHTYEEMKLKYNKEEDTFSFGKIYYVTMNRVSLESPQVLMENISWSGLGGDGFYTSTKKNHLFAVDIYQMTENTVSGKLTVSYKDKVDHLTEFTGRGYKEDGIYHFEIKLQTPRSNNASVFNVTLESLWLRYDPENETLKVSGLLYSATLEKEK
jgi:RNA polymerase sigma factor (sigma-70 family)